MSLRIESVGSWEWWCHNACIHAYYCFIHILILFPLFPLSPSPFLLPPFPPLPHTLQTSGIIVLVMLFSSCLCCCSVFSLCCGDFPKAVKIIGVVLFIIVCLALSVYIGWVALGTYFATEIRSADTVCRNTIIYLCLLYIYLVVLALVGIVLVVWKCHDLRTKSKSSAVPSHKVPKSERGST